MLDLVSSLYVEMERTVTDPRSQSPCRRTSCLLVVWELASLEPRSKYHQLGVVDSLFTHAGAQLIQGLSNGRGLCDGVAWMSGRH
jgi:hypothetical protein